VSAVTGPFSGALREPGRYRVVVVVGTDHHPFDRLIRWTNEWLASHRDMSDTCFVQYGTSTVRPECPASSLLAVDALAALLDAAEVVVCHGGPSSMSDAWCRGITPVVVPRLASLGEHVDDHQVVFSERVEQVGKIAVARTFADFSVLLDKALADPASGRVNSLSSEADEAVARIGGLVEELLSRPRRRKRRARRNAERSDPAAPFLRCSAPAQGG
jgi:UDP-N-acetylglucosamine transferase subunit ALG13